MNEILFKFENPSLRIAYFVYVGSRLHRPDFLGSIVNHARCPCRSRRGGVGIVMSEGIKTKGKSQGRCTAKSQSPAGSRDGGL